MPILRFFRQPALNEEATAALLLEANIASPLIITSIESEFCFNVESSAPVSEAQLHVLSWLFTETFEPDQTASASFLLDPSPGWAIVEVGPRLAFSTAWSSNAVSICKACGLVDVVRVERSRRFRLGLGSKATPEATAATATAFSTLVHDRMTECVYAEPVSSFHSTGQAASACFTVPVLAQGVSALVAVNEKMGLGFDEQDMAMYLDLFTNKLKRDPTDVEIYDMAQSNSEHSRHWFFGGRMVLDGQEMDTTLFKMVKATCTKTRLDGVTPSNSVIAFHDNSSAIRAATPVNALKPVTAVPASGGAAGGGAGAGGPCAMGVSSTLLHPILTAETHNFPCAVAPFPGAETGTGGRLRDVQATGRGAHTMAGISAYCFGNLNLPGYALPWEDPSFEYPAHLAHPRRIAVEASNGASDYGNKYGEPVVHGFCRSFGMRLPTSTSTSGSGSGLSSEPELKKPKMASEADQVGERVEWVKPIMFSAGIGQLDDCHTSKGTPSKGMLVVKVGGPAYRIGMGGGAASSRVNDASTAALDFNAVQRGDAEMENRMNRLLRACIELGPDNPIVSIHDQGCGGNGNVLKEIVEEQGARYDIRAIDCGDPTLSVCEIWGAEYQENNALLLHPKDEAHFKALAKRENCPVSVVGEVTGDGKVVVVDSAQQTDPTPGGVATPVDLPLELVLGSLPPKVFVSNRSDLAHPNAQGLAPLTLPHGLTVRQALERVLRLPSVASKRWLVHKVDRSVTGLIAQQQCVGPLQLPLSNVAVIAQSHFTKQGIATACGEQPIKGLVSSTAMARMTVAETLTNLMWASLTHLEDVKCSGNWMWAAKLKGEGARMWDACEALRDALLLLGVGIDGGKDSLSMAAGVGGETVKAPGMLTMTAYCTCDDHTLTVTPDLKGQAAAAGGSSTLVLVDLGAGRTRMGGTALAQVFSQLGNESPDLDTEGLKSLVNLVQGIQTCVKAKKLLAGHDRSDGGLATCLLEMAFSGNCGFDVTLPSSATAETALDYLFNEEAGCVVEVADADLDFVLTALASVKPAVLGKTTKEKRCVVRCASAVVLDSDMTELRDVWEATSFELEKRQSVLACVAAEQSSLKHRTGPDYHMSFQVTQGVCIEAAKELTTVSKHKVAVLRQEGSNGDREMCAALHAAGLEAWDVTVSDLLEKRVTLEGFRGLVFVGGFSYADVCDSGKGWAAVIKFNPHVWEQFQRFRSRPDTFSLGVCNGCQFLALLGWVPALAASSDAAAAAASAAAASDAVEGVKQPRFVHNASGKFESRWSTVTVLESPAVLLQGMAGSSLGVWVAHGEGRAHFPDQAVLDKVLALNLAPLRYAHEEKGNQPTEEYPFNPNGSPHGIASLCSPDGRHLAMMPHPERCFLKWQWPYFPDHLNANLPSSGESGRGGGDDDAAGPWLFLFQNAKRFCDLTAAEK